MLEDIKVEILADRIDVSEILKRRQRGLRKLIRRNPQEVDPTIVPLDGGKVQIVWPRKEEALRIRPSFGELSALCRERDDKKETWRIRGRVARALADVARALTQAPQEAARHSAQPFQAALRALLDSWLQESTEAKAEAREILANAIPTQLLVLKTKALRLDADIEFWGKSPWTSKGMGTAALERQEKTADKVTRFSEEALHILRSIREDGRTDRAYFYSLKGRSLYMKFDFDAAYREFDLARAGLPEATVRERETLAVILLRQAECLLLHSDHAITQWAMDLVKEDTKDLPGFQWSQCLSTEGRRKLQREEEASIEKLLRLSLANCAPDRLGLAERRLYRLPAGSQELSDQLGATRSRLASANELLERVERLLESSRSKVEWWACLFQLRSQLAVERLLLLLSGDLSPALTGGDLGATPSETRRDVPVDADWQKHFINRFQEHLRRGVRAVRQGLDIVVPNDPEREESRLKRDVLLNRLLRTWSELMVCGAYATGIGQSQPTNQIEDGNLREYEQTHDAEARWEQWRYLNWLAGLTRLLQSRELKQWFLDRKWDVTQTGLAARASVLARVDLCLAKGRTFVQTERGPIPLEGGDALNRLRQALQEFQP